MTHLRCVLIPGGLGFTVTERKIVSIDLENVSVKCEKYGALCAATSVLFAGIDPRERLEFIRRGQVLYRVELELGFKVIC